MRLRFLAVAAALLLATPSARSDSFSYALSDIDGDHFYLISPVLITKNTLLPTISCEFVGPCDHVLIGPEGYTNSDTDAPGFLFFGNRFYEGSINSYNFKDWFTVGEHIEVEDGLTYISFTITQIPSPITPEPSSFLLLGTGLLGIAAAARRRFA